LIVHTGWTWEYIDAHMTLPRLAAMTRRWKLTPPPAVQLARISQYLGIAPQERKAESPRELAQKASEIGVPIMNKLPDDPCLKFLDPRVPIGAGLDFIVEDAAP
jgi:hypothetical protein